MKDSRSVRLEPSAAPGHEALLRVAEPVITAEDRRAVAETLEASWVSGYGPTVERFEVEFSAYCGARFGTATPSGATALHLALAALGVGPGDETSCRSFA